MSTAPLPQQRQHPGEGHGKCNPERDARPPMFPNQADPPPQRPWPATSDEGNTVPAPAQKKMAGTGVDENERSATCGGGPAGATITSADDVHRPWTVMVEDGRIVGRYRAEDAHEAGRDATRITLGGAHLDVYEVDARECLPPPVGERVDPVALGWVRVG